jgi:hypothetical protein
MEVQEDFREFLALLNEHEVEFMIVGGYALAFHGAPRFTGDIDIFVKPDHQNAKQIIKALVEFGFSSPDLTIDDFKYPDKVIQLGLPPVRIDIITSISGVSWEEADDTKVLGLYGDISVSFIGKKQFIKNKRAIGRKKDLADIEALGEE